MAEYGWIGDPVLFARYVEARASEKRRDDMYRAYLTDGLYAISNCVSAKVNGGQSLAKRYIDMLPENRERAKKREESADEIAARVIEGAGIKFA